MIQAGRKSAKAITLAPVHTLERMVTPPSDMPMDQVKTWTTVVKSPAFALIGQEAYPLLTEYCRAVSASDKIAAELESFEPGWLCEDEGLKRWERLLNLQAKIAGVLANLSLKLRIAPSARNDRDKGASRQTRGMTRKPWEVDNGEE